MSIKSIHNLFRVTLNPSITDSDPEPFTPAEVDLPRGVHLFDSTGDYYSIGEIDRVDTGFDWAVVRHSSNGTPIWSQTIGSLGRAQDRVADAVVNKFDELVVTGLENMCSTT